MKDIFYWFDMFNLLLISSLIFCSILVFFNENLSIYINVFLIYKVNISLKFRSSILKSLISSL